MSRSFVVVGARLFRPDAERLGSRIEEATLVVREGRIAAIGGNVPAELPTVQAHGRLVTPGLVDSHTHLVFAGDRAREFAERAAGVSYLEHARRGGGIAASVRATRAASVEDLVRLAKRRLVRLAANGVTTCEVKTGYGLSAESERAMLEAAAALASDETPRITPTLLAAHSIPPEVATPEARAAWVQRICDELIPESAQRGVERIDVFVEQSAYTHDEARRVAEAAKKHGLAIHLHVDQLTANGGAELAAELGAQAVAHLERVSDAGIAALARAGTVVVLLPTATLAAREPAYAPARRIVEAGCRIALSTNLNPGTAPTESTALLLFLASVGLQLTPEESLWAATRGGALALGRRDLGLLEEGAPADLVLWDAFDPAHLAYHAAVNHVRTVWRDGRAIASNVSVCDGAL